ncbi:MAG: DUF4956 domain-containing protein, partial [Candidatus Marinimicrobia bacterium]|nr:DUF4956 domain-containing protein [Candidatus Neomarinimicrobiota bacterium]
VIRYLYMNYGRSLNNREYFANIFMLLSLATCCVIIIVKYSLALSLGLVGALSIVRFRAAIKEPEELVYLFLVIALGLAFGANQFLIGLILLIIASLIIFASSSFIKTNEISDHVGILIILSGSKECIKNLRSNKLNDLISDSSLTILKEIEYSGNNGKLVLKASMNNEIKTLIEKFENLTASEDIDLNIISDVNVPA